MNATDIVLEFIGLMDRLSIDYMLVGSYSSNIYGRPRSTQDADFVLACTDAALADLRKSLGYGFRFDPQMSFETVTATTRYIIECQGTAFKVELFLLSDDPHDQARFSRRRCEVFEDHNVWFPTPEDVVITKLRWSKGGRRSKDIADVSDLLAVRASQLDLGYIRHWCDVHGTRELLEQLLKEAT